MNRKVMTVTKKLISLGCVLFLTGCALFSQQKAEIYPMSYDKTYDTALSALDGMEHWNLISTDALHGVIEIQADGYWRGETKIKFIVKRIDPYRTELKLYHKHATPFTQKFFDAMDHRVAEQALTHPS